MDLTKILERMIFMKKLLSVVLTLLLMAGVIAVAPVMASAAAPIEVANATELAAVLSSVADGDTIKLLDDITYDSAIYLYNKTVYLDLNGNTLNATSGLSVQDGELLLADPANGAFNVSGQYPSLIFALSAYDSKIEVTNVTGMSYFYAVSADGSNAEVIVYGNVSQPGTGASVRARNGAEVTVEGTITSVVYIDLAGTEIFPEDFTIPSTKAGYLTYTDGTSTVWVKCNDHDFGAAWNKNATGHWHDACSLCGAADTAQAHTYGAWVEDTAATATTDGTRHRDCSVCGYREDGTIPATGETEPDSLWQKIVSFITGNWLWIAIGAIGAGGVGAVAWFSTIFWKIVSALAVVIAALVGIFILF